MEGRLNEAARTLERAAKQNPAAHPWSIAWFSAQIDKQQGNLNQAHENLQRLVETDFAEARRRGFDFSQDYRLLNELGAIEFELAKRQRGARREPQRRGQLQQAVQWFAKTLTLDPENLTAHYNLALIYQQLGANDCALEHQQSYRRYKPDDNARDRTIGEHRRKHHAANHAAEPVVIYDLQAAVETAL